MGASMVILAVGLGMFTSTNSVFVKPVCESLGFSRGQFTLHRTIITLASACVMPFYGRVIGKAGIKKTLLAGALALSLVTVGYAFANRLWHFYLLAFANGVFYNAVSFMTIGLLVGCWFKDKRGIATGLAYSGSGLGGAMMIPVISRVITLAGWRFAYAFMGILGMAVLIPVIAVFIKDRPEIMGLAHYTSTARKTEENKAELPISNITLKESLRTSRFWLLLVAFFFIAVFAGATNTHSASYLGDIGYSAAQVSAVVSLFMLFLTIGKIILGILYDRYGAMAGNLFVAVCGIIFPVAALLSHISLFPWVYAVAVGLASCGVSVPLPILISRYFGDRDYTAFFSLFTVIGIAGPSLSVPVMGAVYDGTGSYQIAWVALLVFSVIIAACLITVEYKFSHKEAQK